MIHITVDGQPVPQSRPRVTRHGVFYPDKVRAYREHVTLVAKAAMRAREPLQGALRVSCVFFIAPPKSTSKKALSTMLYHAHTKKPDTDNLLKSITDSMNGIVWADDAQIYDMTARKFYGLPARVEIFVEEVRE